MAGSVGPAIAPHQGYRPRQFVRPRSAPENTFTWPGRMPDHLCGTEGQDSLRPRGRVICRFGSGQPVTRK